MKRWQLIATIVAVGLFCVAVAEIIHFAVRK